MAKPAPSPASTFPPAPLRERLLEIAVLCAVFLAYLPALKAGFVWDDDAHVTRQSLRSLEGLYRIWFDLGSTQQHYPLLHTLFWVEYQLWGAAPLGYHLANLSLHGGVVWLVMLLVRRLGLPLPWLAGLIFGLHPVMVESVAWITEQKNTLSALFYLASAWVYLRFDESRKGSHYAWALGLFVCALLSKTVTASLPAALLVVFWWRRGRLRWRADVVPLLPWFVLGASGGLFTAWVERTYIGAEGAPFSFSWVERGLIAGRVICFYFGKLVWPAELIFFYPRWQIDGAAVGQYVFPSW